MRRRDDEPLRLTAGMKKRSGRDRARQPRTISGQTIRIYLAQRSL
ncbi:hypothetical protein [Paraburkholderia phytofirmans]|nr:hypothetical protein [Paraburkholderia phytofirmans]